MSSLNLTADEEHLTLLMLKTFRFILKYTFAFDFEKERFFLKFGQVKTMINGINDILELLSIFKIINHIYFIFLNKNTL